MNLWKTEIPGVYSFSGIFSWNPGICIIGLLGDIGFLGSLKSQGSLLLQIGTTAQLLLGDKNR